MSQHGRPNSTPEHDVVVIGAGFSGLYMVHLLRSAGFQVHGIEKADDVGGTWYWNRYPGARCDSESLTYCYTFDAALQQEWTWTDRYPSGPQVLAYLGHVADRFDLRRSFSFGVTVTRAEYHEAEHTWTVETDRGEVLTTRYLISAVGSLSVPNTPQIPGIDDFGGEWFHTGRWPHQEVSFTGRRVAVVGTGSSGIQVIQEIAKSAAELTIFQRTPNYTIPLRNQPLDPDVQALWKRHYPELNAITRHSPGGLPFMVGDRKLADTPREEALGALEAGWQLGGFRFMFGTFSDITSDFTANSIVADFVRDKIDDIVDDQEVAALLKPDGYPLGAKRIPLQTNYFEVFNQPNVQLVDLNTSPISGISPTGIRTDRTLYEVDTIVFATGFDAITGPLSAINIIGRDATLLRDVWQDGPRSYLGLASAGFPNLFTIGGPSSPGVISNVPPTLEHNAEWILDCLLDLRERGVTQIEAEPQAQQQWIDYVHELAQSTMYPHAKSSWYNGSNITGIRQPFPVFTGGFDKYVDICAGIFSDDLRGFRQSGPPGELSRSSSQQRESGPGAPAR